jgi:formylglycine-generating enzyme required for sulfatase activity
MHGNVYEWCEDIYHDSYSNSPIDGSAWLTGGERDERVLRGGSWPYDSRFCRSAGRSRLAPGIRTLDIGFRVVVSARTP